jgi:hypothetical protein
MEKYTIFIFLSKDRAKILFLEKNYKSLKIGFLAPNFDRSCSFVSIDTKVKLA